MGFFVDFFNPLRRIPEIRTCDSFFLPLLHFQMAIYYHPLITYHEIAPQVILCRYITDGLTNH
jgi:hypothetical protein